MSAGLAFQHLPQERSVGDRPSSAALRVSKLLSSSAIDLPQLKDASPVGAAEVHSWRNREQPAGNLGTFEHDADSVGRSANDSTSLVEQQDGSSTFDRLHIHVHSHLRSPVEVSAASAASEEASVQLRKALAEQSLFSEFSQGASREQLHQPLTPWSSQQSHQTPKASRTFHMHYHVHKHIHKAFVLSDDGSGLVELPMVGRASSSSALSSESLPIHQGSEAPSPKKKMLPLLTDGMSSSSSFKPPLSSAQDSMSLPSLGSIYVSPVATPASKASSAQKSGEGLNRAKTEPGMSAIQVRLSPPHAAGALGLPHPTMRSRTARLAAASSARRAEPQTFPLGASTPDLKRSKTAGAPVRGLQQDSRMGETGSMGDQALVAHPAARRMSNTTTPSGKALKQRRKMGGDLLSPAGKVTLRDPGGAMMRTKSMPPTAANADGKSSDDDASDASASEHGSGLADVHPAMNRIASRAHLTALNVPKLDPASNRPGSRQGSKRAPSKRTASKRAASPEAVGEAQVSIGKAAACAQAERVSKEQSGSMSPPEERQSLKRRQSMGRTPEAAEEHHSSEGSARSSMDNADAKEGPEARARQSYKALVKAIGLDEESEVKHSWSTIIGRLRVGNGTEGFSSYALGAIRQAWDRFSVRGAEISDDVLHEVLRSMGYLKPQEEICKQLAEKVTPFASLTMEEFVAFMRKYLEWEVGEYAKDFNACDSNRDGVISVQELQAHIKSRSYNTFDNLTQELLALTKSTEDSGFNLEGFVYAVSIVELTKGFTSDEISELRLVFEHYAVSPETGDCVHPRKVLEVASLGHALLHIFGPQSDDLARKIAKTLGVQLENNYDVAGGDRPEGLDFAEFLQWGRQVREAELKEYQRQFDEFDDDGSGRIDRDELTRMLFALGYTPLRKVVDELMTEADPNGDGIDFEEFVIMMAFFRRKECFSNDDVLQLQIAFDKFDVSGSGSLTCYSLLCLMRHMGYIIEVHEAKRYMREVDYDGSNTMEFRGFLRLMVLQREADIVYIRDVFGEGCTQGDEAEEQFPAMMVPWALDRLKYRPVDEMMEKVKLEYGELPELLSFEELLDVVDVCQRGRQEQNRRNANFSQDDIARFHNLFGTYDADGNDVIERGELGVLLQDLGVPMATAKDQQRMLQMIEEARAAAIKVGVPASECGEPGSPGLTFKVLVHLVRLLRNIEDMKEVQRDFDLAEESHFTGKEVSEFYTIFRHSAVPEKKDSPFAGFAKPKQIAFEALRRLLPALGVQVTPQLRAQLDAKIKNMGIKTGLLDFREFVLLMRWLLDDTGMEGAAERKMLFERQRQTLADNFGHIQAVVSDA